MMTMPNQYTVMIERDGKWYIAYCPEVPGANGQGRTIEECKASLADAIELILEDRIIVTDGGEVMPAKNAFSLVELLTVLALILILILTALPSFIESKTASNLSLARSRLMAMKQAMQYHERDWGSVPPDFNDPGLIIYAFRCRAESTKKCSCAMVTSVTTSGGLQTSRTSIGPLGEYQHLFYAPGIFCPLTTPVPYVTQLQTIDPFQNGKATMGYNSFYDNGPVVEYGLVASAGPDRIAGHWSPNYSAYGICGENTTGKGMPYSPTNGSKSCGDLWTMVSPCVSTATSTCMADQRYDTRDHFGSDPPSDDSDDDSIKNVIEAAAPNRGDGNSDGIPDTEEPHVVSLPNAADGKFVTLVAPVGAMFAEVKAVSRESVAGVPGELLLPVGLWDFRVEGVPASGTFTVQFRAEGDHAWTGYYKYGSVPSITETHWYDFDFDGSTGVSINAPTITLQFVDGSRGDDDLVKNRIIDDLGGPVAGTVSTVKDWSLYGE